MPEKETSKDDSKKNQKSEKDETLEEEEDSLEEIVNDLDIKIDEEQFRNFFKPKNVDFSPSLEKMNASQENTWTRKESPIDLEDEKAKISYLASPEDNGLKYEHYEVDPLKNAKRFDPTDILKKTPDKIIEEQKKLHKQVFVQDPMLKAAQESKDRDYFATPDFNTKKDFQIISQDYKKMNRR